MLSTVPCPLHSWRLMCSSLAHLRACGSTTLLCSRFIVPWLRSTSQCSAALRCAERARVRARLAGLWRDGTDTMLGRGLRNRLQTRTMKLY